MDHFAGLDVSVKDTSVCIVDSTGKIVREVTVASEPDALLAILRNPAYDFKHPDGICTSATLGRHYAPHLD
jgi:transposase